MVFLGLRLLKGVRLEIFDFRLFNESVSPRTLSIPLGPFRIFSKILGDLRNVVFIAGVVDTSDKLLTGNNDTSD
jgi:hypothetical protein